MFSGQTLRFWLNASRYPALGQSLSPYVLGVLLAGVGVLRFGYQVEWTSLVFVVCGLVGVAAAHTGFNLLDDYFDWQDGAVAKRQELMDGGMRARMGKCTYLAEANLQPRDIVKAASVFFAVAAGLGTVVFIGRGWPVLIFAGLVLLLGVLYAGPPLRLSYHGFGELLVGVIFGPAVVCAAYFVAIGQLDAIAIWASIPAGLLTSNILVAHSVMDFESDQAAERRTLVVLLGSKRAGVWACAVLIAASYGCVGIGIARGVFPLASAAIALTLPLAVAFLWLMRMYLIEPDRQVPVYRWFGPMGDVALARSVGIDFFVVRWRLARNLLMANVLILAATNFMF